MFISQIKIEVATCIFSHKVAAACVIAVHLRVCTCMNSVNTYAL